MLDRVKAIFTKGKTPARETAATPLAVAALLVEAARADENYTDRERSLIEAALAAQFSLDAAGARALRENAEGVQAEALDLHRFTRVAKTMAAEEKLALLERLWTIVLSDGARDPHEDALIRRVCGLIYVSDPESAAARKRAEISLKGPRDS